jgi:hypothetical protein
MKNYLTTEKIKFFLEANLLHAVDNKLLNFDYNDSTISVAEGISDKGKVYSIEVSTGTVRSKDFKLLTTAEFPFEAAHEQDHLRMMMGMTMVVMTELKKLEEKPVLTIVKGGKNE